VRLLKNVNPYPGALSGWVRGRSTFREPEPAKAEGIIERNGQAGRFGLKKNDKKIKF